MPSAYEIDRAAGVAFVLTWGAMNDDDAQELRARLIVDPNFRPELRFVYDATEVTRFEVSTRVIQSMAAKNPCAGGRRALIAGPGLVFGAARMYEAFAATAADEFRVCSELREALEWVGLPTTEVPEPLRRLREGAGLREVKLSGREETGA